MFKNLFLASLLLLANSGCSQSNGDSSTSPKISVQDSPVQVVSVNKIWDGAEHSAFSDLILFKDLFFCAFRESNAHEKGNPGTIRILTSKDGVSWSNGATLKRDKLDLRDPMLSKMPDGRLMLNVEGATYDSEGEIVKRRPFVAFSVNGVDWTPLIDLGMDNEWIWRVTWHEGSGYAFSYVATDYLPVKNKPWELKLVRTIEGLKYETVTTFDLPGNPSEATIRFTKDGKMVALLRRQKNAMIGVAKPPYYNKWTWKETNFRLGGPNFLILPDGKMWAAAREMRLVGEGEKAEILGSTVVAKMTEESFEPVLTLPSGGDTGYPGMVYKDGKLYISYYSSHEGISSIYFAVLGF